MKININKLTSRTGAQLGESFVDFGAVRLWPFAAFLSGLAKIRRVCGATSRRGRRLSRSSPVGITERGLAHDRTGRSEVHIGLRGAAMPARAKTVMNATTAAPVPHTCLDACRFWVLPRSVNRFALRLLAPYLAFAACTPEATVVDAAGGSVGANSDAGRTSKSGSSGTGGTDAGGTDAGGTDAGGAAAGKPSGGSAGNGGGGSNGGDNDCAPITSPRAGCVSCLKTNCATELDACANNDCACGSWGQYSGQMSCILACISDDPMNPDGCAAGCGIGKLGDADPATKALFDCEMNPPSGPPACGQCLPPQ